MGKGDEQFIKNEIEIYLKRMKRCSTSFSIAKTSNCPPCLLLVIEPQVFPTFLAAGCAYETKFWPDGYK